MYKRVPECQAIAVPFTGVVFWTMGTVPCITMAFVVVCENIARTIILIITLWDNVDYLVTYYILRDLEHQPMDATNTQFPVLIAIISSALLLIPTICMLNFSELALDSFLGFLSTAAISVIVVINFAVDFDSAMDMSRNLSFWPQDVYGIVLCFGVFVSSLAGHACLPSIWQQMQNPDDYNNVLNISWSVIFILNLMTGVIGYLTFGDSVKTILTKSMMEDGGALSTICVICIIINITSHIPIGIHISSALPESVLQVRHHIVKRVSRTIFYSVIIYIAWLLRNNVLTVSAFMGSVLTLTISVLCPLMGQLINRFNARRIRKNVRMIVTIVVLIVFAVASGCMLYVDLHRHE